MKNIYSHLVYAGAIPFVFGAICLVFGIRQLPLLGSVEYMLSVYALVICSFLAGVHWGQHLQMKSAWRFVLPIVSNITAVMLWLGFLMLRFQSLSVMFIVALVVFLVIDQRLLQHNRITWHYFRTRCFVSAIVIITLVIARMV